MTVLPKESLDNEFISQLRIDEYVSIFMTDLHSQILEHLLYEEMDEHLDYEKNKVEGNNCRIFRNEAYKKRSGAIIMNQQ